MTACGVRAWALHTLMARLRRCATSIKTSLIKLLTRLYSSDEGRILLDGSDLQDWDEQLLRQRIGVISQDYIRYLMTVGENIGVGDVDAF